MTYKVQTWVHCLFSLDLSLDFKKLNFFMFFKTTGGRWPRTRSYKKDDEPLLNLTGAAAQERRCLCVYKRGI